MASKIKRAFQQKDVRNKILFLLLMLFLYRIGASIPVPGIPYDDIANKFTAADSGMGALLSLTSGGALNKLSFLSLGIGPYITSSILLQLAGLVFPKVAKWKKDGAEGRKHIIKWTRILTLVLGVMNAIGYDFMFQTQYGVVYPGSVPPLISNVVIVFVLTVGALLVMLIGESIRQYSGGTINGLSAIVLVGVCSSVPSAFAQSVQTSGDGLVGLGLTLVALVLVLIVLPLVVEVERAQRRVPIKSTKSGANSMYARTRETNYIPVPVDVAGLYGLIFASSAIMIPVYLSAWMPDVQWLSTVAQAMSSGPVSWAVNFALVVFFCFFMAGVNFNSEDVADNLKKQGSYVPGVRPGIATTRYFEYIVNHITLFGALFIAVLAVGSSIAFSATSNSLLQAFGGTALLIAISGSLQLTSALEQDVQSGDPEAVLQRLGR